MLTFLSRMTGLESLEKDWHSTAFTVVWIAGQATCGLSLCVLGGLVRGSRPSSKGSAGKAIGLDWGNLLLAAMMFWAYVSFAQYLIIWAGTFPRNELVPAPGSRCLAMGCAGRCALSASMVPVFSCCCRAG